jgi:hypothetical protein
MDGLARMTALTARNHNDRRRQRDDEAFRAWHRQPDAAPDPSEAGDGAVRSTTRRRGIVARLVARLAAA